MLLNNRNEVINLRFLEVAFNAKGSSASSFLRFLLGKPAFITGNRSITATTMTDKLDRISYSGLLLKSFLSIHAGGLLVGAENDPLHSA